RSLIGTRASILVPCFAFRFPCQSLSWPTHPRIHGQSQTCSPRISPGFSRGALKPSSIRRKQAESFELSVRSPLPSSPVSDLA
ncbi:hypothetical protein LX36DRAFT_637204, partial [Colletotrichum falcatum]